jgi:hypothetical protein
MRNRQKTARRELLLVNWSHPSGCMSLGNEAVSSGVQHSSAALRLRFSNLQQQYPRPGTRQETYGTAAVLSVVTASACDMKSVGWNPIDSMLGLMCAGPRSHPPFGSMHSWSAKTLN